MVSDNLPFSLQWRHTQWHHISSTYIVKPSRADNNERNTIELKTDLVEVLVVLCYTNTWLLINIVVTELLSSGIVASCICVISELTGPYGLFIKIITCIQL